MSALDLAREHMARTGLDGYTLAVLMACEPKCWTPVPCPSCGSDLGPRGRAVDWEASCCERARQDPAANPRHLWRENDEARWYSDLDWCLRYEAGEFRGNDDD